MIMLHIQQTYLVDIYRILVAIIASTCQAATVMRESEDKAALFPSRKGDLKDVWNAASLTGQP